METEMIFEVNKYQALSKKDAMGGACSTKGGEEECI
jgi:hypothetical protein